MIVKKLYTQQSEPTYQSGIIAALSLGTIAAMGLSTNEHQKNREHEAEAIPFQKLSKLGYCKVLEDKHDDYKLTLDITKNPELRLRGSNYPTLAEYVKLTADALNQCEKSYWS